jgi:hypothetical protein
MALSSVSVYEVNYLKDIKAQISDFTLIGDWGYLSAEIQLNLFETGNIKLRTPMRNNQKEYKKEPYLFKKKEEKNRNFILAIMRSIYYKT